MLAQWLGDLVGKMHRYQVSKKDLANELGVTREYISAILNGHREPAGIENRMNEALDSILKKRQVTE